MKKENKHAGAGGKLERIFLLECRREKPPTKLDLSTQSDRYRSCTRRFCVCSPPLSSHTPLNRASSRKMFSFYRFSFFIVQGFANSFEFPIAALFDVHRGSISLLRRYCWPYDLHSTAVFLFRSRFQKEKNMEIRNPVCGNTSHVPKKRPKKWSIMKKPMWYINEIVSLCI